MENIILSKWFNYSTDQIQTTIDEYCAAQLGITDLKHTERWHGDYHGAELQLHFVWEGNKCIWIATTHIGDGPFCKYEHYAGYYEVNRIRLTSDIPVDVKIVCNWELLQPFFQGMADYLLPPRNLFELYVDDIDSFSKVREVMPQDVRALVPLNLLEDQIQTFLEEIIGENVHQPDWPGETNDLLTSQLRVNGKRLRAAFILKGRGTSGKLRIRDCGKKGDQIVKLANAPADLYIIQHINEVDEQVIVDLRDKIQLKNRQGTSCQMCIIDGTDTARILKAYSKI